MDIHELPDEQLLTAQAQLLKIYQTDFLDEPGRLRAQLIDAHCEAFQAALRRGLIDRRTIAALTNP